MKPEEREIVFQFLGDISLNGLFCDPQYFQPLTENLAVISEKLGSCDLRCGNFESPLWAGQGFNLMKNPRVCTTEEAASSILPLDLDVAFLANNHFYDCLENGVRKTTEFLENNGIATLGAGDSTKKAKDPFIKIINGQRVGIMNYLDLATNPHCDAAEGVFANTIDEGEILDEIAALACRTDILVVSLHWGKYELLRYPEPSQRFLGRKMIEAGAKIVVGHHSHCTQGVETWQDGVIFYSLGNFLFGGLKGRETSPWPTHSRQVSVATVKIKSDMSLQVKMAYFIQNNHQLEVDVDKNRVKIQDKLNKSLKYESQKYARTFRLELFWQWGVMSPIRFVNASGGIFGALKRIRKEHFIALRRMILK